ncbi:MAG: hypothetical protein QNI99_11570 [Woeseiaceae bacterium]|nr:hypothetical protein [Woeseiaceae bacterium]
MNKTLGVAVAIIATFAYTMAEAGNSGVCRASRNDGASLQACLDDPSVTEVRVPPGVYVPVRQTLTLADDGQALEIHYTHLVLNRALGGFGPEFRFLLFTIAGVAVDAPDVPSTYAVTAPLIELIKSANPGDAQAKLDTYFVATLGLDTVSWFESVGYPPDLAQLINDALVAEVEAPHDGTAGPTYPEDIDGSVQAAIERSATFLVSRSGVTIRGAGRKDTVLSGDRFGNDGSLHRPSLADQDGAGLDTRTYFDDEGNVQLEAFFADLDEYRLAVLEPDNALNVVTIDGATNVKIERLTISGGNTIINGGLIGDGVRKDSGGGILMTATDPASSAPVGLALDRVALRENLSIGGTGGALATDVRNGNTLTLALHRTTFFDNSARSGGAMLMLNAPAFNSSPDSTLSIRRSRFERNSSPGNAAAINLQMGSAANAVPEFRNTVFRNNHTQAPAGAMLIIGGDVSQTLTMSQLEFESNSSFSGSGLLTALNTYEVVVEDSEFVGNRDIDTTDSLFGGAAISIRNAALTVRNSVFESNLSNDAGVAINSQEGSLTLEDNRFRYNLFTPVAPGDDSGAISGGAVLISGGTATIVGNRFVENEMIGPGVGGGAVGAINSAVITEMSDNRFRSNRAGIGGAVSLVFSQIDEMRGNRYRFNETVSQPDGLIFADGPTGGAVAFIASDVGTMSDERYVGNRSAGNGGAMGIDTVSSAFGAAYPSTIGEMRNMRFVGNCADGDGGAIYVSPAANDPDAFLGPSTIELIDSSAFMENHAAGSGGAVANRGVILLLSNSVFELNSAEVSDPAIFNIGTLTEMGNVFNGNLLGGTCAECDDH